MVVSYPITAVVQAGGFVKLYHTLVDGFSILALPIVYILFKMGFGAEWSYIISIVIFAIAHFLRLYVLKKVFPTLDVQPYLLRFLLPAAILFIALYVLLEYLSVFLDFNLVNTMIYCIICCLCAFLSGALLILSTSERRMIFNMICQKRINK